MNEISKRLLAAIQSKGYSYGELSNLTSIPKSAIQRYATGATEKIPLDRLEKLASVLGVSSSYLMGWENDRAAVPSDTTNDDSHEVRMIARAGKRMTPEKRQQMLEVLKTIFPEEFKDDEP